MSDEVCPKCGAPLGEMTETPTGKKLQRCSSGSWNKELKKNEGCDYVKWFQAEPVELDEKCRKKVQLGDGMWLPKKPQVVIILNG